MYLYVCMYIYIYIYIYNTTIQITIKQRDACARSAVGAARSLGRPERSDHRLPLPMASSRNKSTKRFEHRAEIIALSRNNNIEPRAEIIALNIDEGMTNDDFENRESAKDPADGQRGVTIGYSCQWP